ncbi:MAG: hypothetical protein O2797_08450 [Bacteroidetes bacterium]|nr:hypothetical protein [Bacteroidota bacterium]
MALHGPVYRDGLLGVGSLLVQQLKQIKMKRIIIAVMERTAVSPIVDDPITPLFAVASVASESQSRPMGHQEMQISTGGIPADPISGRSCLASQWPSRTVCRQFGDPDQRCGHSL